MQRMMGSKQCMITSVVNACQVNREGEARRKVTAEDRDGPLVSGNRMLFLLAAMLWNEPSEMTEGIADSSHLPSTVIPDLRWPPRARGVSVPITLIPWAMDKDN